MLVACEKLLLSGTELLGTHFCYKDTHTGLLGICNLREYRIMNIKTGIVVSFFILSTILIPNAFGMGLDSTSKLLRFKLHFQSRFSFPNGKILAMWGGSVGYTWGPFQREVTLGYQWLGRRGSRHLELIDKQSPVDLSQPIYPRTGAGFFNVGYWHIVHNSKRWKMGFPLEIGLGAARVEYYSLLTDRPLLLATPEYSAIVPLQFGGYTERKFTRWVGAGIQIGYRYNLYRAGGIDNFNGMFYRLRVIVYPAAYRDGYNFVFKGKPLPSPFFPRKGTQSR